MNESLRILTQKIPKRPTIPPVADRIIQLVNNKAAFIDAIVHTIETDAAISAKVIGFSNAAFYRLGGPVTTIQDAVMKVGFDNVKNIALGISLLTIFRPKNGESGEYPNICRHCMAVGVIAKDIVDHLDRRNHEDVFTTGLLHDLGLMVMNVFFPDIFDRVINRFSTGLTFADAEKEVCGFTHGDVGAWLADKWNLPDSIYEVIRHHHAPKLTGRRPEIEAIVHLADILAIRGGFSPISMKGFEGPLDAAAMKLLHLTEKKISDIESRVEEIVDPVKAMLL